jgi:hypothetical protein
VAQGDTAAQASGQVQADTATIGDTAVILTHADSTQQTEVAVGKADELAKHEPARVRPPADSTADAAAVAAAGIASTGNIATGADAVALMSRQGERCVVAASDENRDVLWDMASSPSSLNPCGTGTMTLPRIWTGEKK